MLIFLTPPWSAPPPPTATCDRHASIMQRQNLRSVAHGPGCTYQRCVAPFSWWREAGGSCGVKRGGSGCSRVSSRVLCCFEFFFFAKFCFSLNDEDYHAARVLHSYLHCGAEASQYPGSAGCFVLANPVVMSFGSRVDTCGGKGTPFFGLRFLPHLSRFIPSPKALIFMKMKVQPESHGLQWI